MMGLFEGWRGKGVWRGKLSLPSMCWLPLFGFSGVGLFGCWCMVSFNDVFFI